MGTIKRNLESWSELLVHNISYLVNSETNNSGRSITAFWNESSLEPDFRVHKIFSRVRHLIGITLQVDSTAVLVKQSSPILDTKHNLDICDMSIIFAAI